MKPITFFTLPFSFSEGVCANANCHAGKTPHLYRRCAPTAILGRSRRRGREKGSRAKYMTGEMLKTAAVVDASISYLKKSETEGPRLTRC
jgi:hypothetical protein